MIHCDFYGDPCRPALLLLHGGAALDTFCHQYAFADQYYLIVPHLQGAGQAAEQCYDPKSQLEQLRELIDSLSGRPLAVMGHSLGAQLAVMLVSTCPERFSGAVFLSPWLLPTCEVVSLYTMFSGISAPLLHVKWLVRLQGRYWGMTSDQRNYMADYCGRIGREQYASLFRNTMRLSDFPGYDRVRIPMLAICGSGEMGQIRRSVSRLGENPSCRTLVLPRAGHDFPLRKHRDLNPILLEFFSGLSMA